MNNRNGKEQAADDGAPLWRVRGSFALELEAVAYAVRLLLDEGCDVATAIHQTYANYRERFLEERRAMGLR